MTRQFWLTDLEVIPKQDHETVLKDELSERKAKQNDVII
jgi:hypothetical protein